MARPAPRFSSGFLIALAVLLGLFHVVLGVTSKVGTSVTFDELAHLTAGRVYHVHDDFRLHPENGILPQRLTALPMMLLSPELPPLEGNRAWQRGNVWVLGDEFFYRLSNNTDLMVFTGRGMVALLSMATGLLVFFWSRHLFGWAGAFLSLALYSFCPSFLGHGSLATSDMAMTFFFLATITTWWWQLERPSWWRCVASGLVFGLACVSKFSAVLLLPMMGVLAGWWVVRNRTTRRTKVSVFWVTGSAAAHSVIAWAVIWIFFEFRYRAAGAADSALGFQYPWSDLITDSELKSYLLQGLRKWQVFPEAFIYGAAFVDRFSARRLAFLNGEVGVEGWLAFFPFAFLIKTTLPLLVLIIAGILRWGFRVTRSKNRFDSAAQDLWSAAPLLVLFCVYWAAALTSSLNIGHRHILPTYPVIFILLGGLLVNVSRFREAAMVGLLCFWHAAESTSVRPHYLAYFNQLVGGPRQGFRHLVDSSLDWGQNLPGLAAWLKINQRADEPVYLSYFGTGSPTYEGISSIPLFHRGGEWPPEPWAKLKAGLYCVSVTSLQQPPPLLKTHWNALAENTYRRLKSRAERVRSQRDSEVPAGDAGIVPDELGDAEASRRYNELRFRRLCLYLRIRSPEAVIGYTIHVYRLSAEEIEIATEAPLDVLTDALEASR